MRNVIRFLSLSDVDRHRVETFLYRQVVGCKVSTTKLFIPPASRAKSHFDSVARDPGTAGVLALSPSRLEMKQRVSRDETRNDLAVEHV